MVTTPSPLAHHPVMSRRWLERGGEAEASRPLTPELVKAAKGSEVLAKLLIARGHTTVEAIQRFLSVHEGTYEPTSGVELPDAMEALDRLQRAIEGQEPILVYGDFDVDGITGTSIWVETLKRLGAKVSYYIPDRATEGHGLNSAALMRLVSSRQLKVVVTTDTGISNFNEISLLQGLGVDTIVTDHHEIPEHLPPSIANVNPQLYEDKTHPLANLSGAGVAYKLAELLLEASLPPEEAKITSRQLLDLTATGLVADMVPLTKECRYLVNEGLKVLQGRSRLGLKHILEQAGTPPEAVLTTSTIGFTIGPRLNALGRLENATDAVELLTTTDNQRAYQLAQKLEHLNRKRQQLCDETFIEADNFIQQQGGLGQQKAIILASPKWNPGIIGIVASRLIEKYSVPTFMMVSDEAANTVRCSARSIPGFHLTENLEPLSHYFKHWGGHAGAAGFALPLDKLPAFKNDLHQLAQQKVTEAMALPTLEVDAAITAEQANEGLIELVSYLAPFGMANPEPVFQLKSHYVSAQRPLGEAKKHLKLMVTAKPKQSRGALEALWWNAGAGSQLSTDEPYHFAVTVEKNNYELGPPVQLILKGLQPASGNSPALQATLSTPQAVKPQEPLNIAPQAAPANPSTTRQNPPTPTDTGVHWVDHRGRDALEAFMGQLMLPAQQGRSIRIFHEGRDPDLALIPKNWLVSRGNLTVCDELVFWDIPPSAETLKRCLTKSKAQVVHWVGGKYQQLPTRLEAKVFIKGMFARLKMMEDSLALQATTLTDLASGFACTEETLLLGLQALVDLQQIEVTETPAGLELAWANRTEQRGPSPALATLLTHQLRQSSDFREWALKAPVEQIKQGLAQASPVTPSTVWPDLQFSSTSKPATLKATQPDDAAVMVTA